MSPINIAIDGYSSCGKSTLAKQLANHFHYIYIDSGAMYRAITLYALENGFYEDGELNQQQLIGALDEINVRFERDGEKPARILLNNRDVEDEIRGMHVSEKVSPVAAIPEVRKKLVALQRQMAAEKGVVMDGRDIGTNVIPDAEVKLFMTASPEVRAQRRYDELKAKGQEASFEEVLENLRSRDEQDSSREANPLRQADDAVVIDNSNTGLDDQFSEVLQLIEKITRQP